MSAALHHDEVIAVVGDIDPSIVERIVAIGTTADELTEAVAEIDDELGFDDHRSVEPSTTIAIVRALLAPVLAHRSDHILRGRD